MNCTRHSTRPIAHAGAITLMLTLLLALAGSVAASSYLYLAEEMFFERQPSARAEAMGKGLVAVAGDPFASYYNPAGLAALEGVTASGAHASPLYLSKEAKYTFAGGAIQAFKCGVVGFSDYRFHFDIDQTGLHGETEKGHAEDALQTLTLGTSRISGMLLGVNLSRFHLDWPVVGVDASAYWMDLGALKELALPGAGPVAQSLAFGSCIQNLTAAWLKVGDSSWPLPVILRVGTCYKATWSAGAPGCLNPAEAMVTLEYQDLINSKYYGTVRVGGEVKALEIVALRAGYYRERDYDFGGPREIKEDFTYGFGVEAPLDKLSPHKIPIRISFGITKLEQPSTLRNPHHWPDFTDYSLSVNWVY